MYNMPCYLHHRTKPNMAMKNCIVLVTYHSQIIGSTNELHLAGSLAKPPEMLGFHYMPHVILIE